jgi:hypothetical protein
MTESSFIDLLLNKGIIEINDEGDNYKRPWEVEQAKKLLAAFKEIGRVLNTTSQPPAAIVAEAMKAGVGHNTLEQDFMRMMFRIIETLAEQVEEPENHSKEMCKFTDGRNRSGRQTCYTVVKLFEEKFGKGARPSYLPSV